mgnify:CR=1 FL=1
MRKFILILLTMTLLITAAAAADHPEPILFQGMSWGNTSDQTKDYLIQKGAVTNLGLLGGSPSAALPWVSDSNLEAEYKRQYFTVLGAWENECSPIGGHLVYRLEVIHTAKPNSLVAVVVYFADQGNKVFADLLFKLTTLYGDPAQQTKKWATWIGADESSLHLISTSSQATLTYAATDMVALIHSLEQAEPTIDPNSSDGL